MAHSHDRTLLAALGFQDPDKKDPKHTLACQYLCQPEVALRLATRLWGLQPDERSRAPKEEAYLRTEDEARSASMTAKATLRARRDAVTPAWEAASAALDAARRASRDKRMGDSWARDELTGSPMVNSRALEEAERAAFDLFRPLNDEIERLPKEVGKECFGLHAKGQVEVAITRDRNFLIGFWDVAIGVTGMRLHHSGETYASPIASVCVEVKAAPVDVAAIARQIATYHTAGRPTYTVVATCYPTTKMDRDTLAAKGIHHAYLGPDFDKFCQRARVSDVEGEL